MGQIKDYLQWRTLDGPPIKAGNSVIRPVSQSLMVRSPFGGFVWNRPVAIVVENDEGENRIAIVDITRMVQIALILLSFGFGMVIWLLGRVQANAKRSKEN